MDAKLRELLRSDSAPDEEIEAIIRLRAPEIAVPDVRIVSRFGQIATCRLPVGAIRRVRRHDNVLALNWSRPVGEGACPGVPGQAPSAPADVHDSDLRRPPGITATGKGVCFCIADWGCDPDHQDFKHADGSTRLLALWDQRASGAGDPPQPYGYGRIYGPAEINAALAADAPYDTLGYHPGDADRDGLGAHCTGVMGVAAGNGLAGGPCGVAPCADLVVVHLTDRNTDGLSNLSDSSRLLEAAAWLTETAGGRPWVMNLSVGRSGGAHDACTPVQLALDHLLASAPGGCIVQSAGNYHDRSMHASGHLAAGESRALTVITRQGDRTENEIEVWYDGDDEFRVKLQSPTGAATPWVLLGGQADVLDGDRVVGWIYHREDDPYNHDNQIEIFLYPWAPAGDWTVTLQALTVRDGGYHAWIERDEACSDCQAQFADADADPSSTTGTIANGRLPIVVGAYDAHSPTREIAPFSSSGPTRDGRCGVDLLAPGRGVLTARSGSKGSGGSAGLHTPRNGTSFAAPHVAGAAALVMESAGRPLTVDELRALLLGTAQRHATHETPSPRSGWGYLDIAAAVRAAAALRPGAPAPPHTPAQIPPHRPHDNGRRPAMTRGFEQAEELSFDPDAVYGAVAYERGGPLADWVDDTYTVVGRPGRPPHTSPRAGDVLVSVALGEPGLGRVAVLAGAPLGTRASLAATAVRMEGGGPGAYAIVVDRAAALGKAPQRIGRRVFDASGEVPLGRLLLRAGGVADRAPEPIGAATAEELLVLEQEPSSAEDVIEMIDDAQDLDEHASILSYKIGGRWNDVQLAGKIRLSMVASDDLTATPEGWDASGPTIKRPKTELERVVGKDVARNEAGRLALKAAAPEIKAKIKSGLSAAAITGYYNHDGLVLGLNATIDGPQYEVGLKTSEAAKGGLTLVTVRLRLIGRLEDLERGLRLDVQGDFEAKLDWEAAAKLVKAGAVKVGRASATRIAEAARFTARFNQELAVSTAKEQLGEHTRSLDYWEAKRRQSVPGSKAFAKAEDGVVRARLQMREAQLAVKRLASPAAREAFEREAAAALTKPSTLTSLGRVLSTPIRKVLGTRLAKTVGRWLLKAIPGLNLLMTIWDLVEVGLSLIDLIRFGPGRSAGDGKHGKAQGAGGAGGSATTRTGATGVDNPSGRGDKGDAGTPPAGAGDTGAGRGTARTPDGTATGTNATAPPQPPPDINPGGMGGDAIAGLAARLNSAAGHVAAAMEWTPADLASRQGTTFTAAELEQLNRIVPETTPDATVQALISILRSRLPKPDGTARNAAELLRLVEQWMKHLNARPAPQGPPAVGIDFVRAARLNPIEQRALRFEPAEFTGDPRTTAASAEFAIAVAEYQRLNDLPVDGIAGPRTVAAWREDEGGPNSPGVRRALAEAARRRRARTAKMSGGNDKAIDPWQYLRVNPSTQRIEDDGGAIKTAIGRKLSTPGGFKATLIEVQIIHEPDDDLGQNFRVIERFRVDAAGTDVPHLRAGQTARSDFFGWYVPATKKRGGIRFDRPRGVSTHSAAPATDDAGSAEDDRKPDLDPRRFFERNPQYIEPKAKQPPKPPEQAFRSDATSYNSQPEALREVLERTWKDVAFSHFAALSDPQRSNLTRTYNRMIGYGLWQHVRVLTLLKPGEKPLRLGPLTLHVAGETHSIEFEVYDAKALRETMIDSGRFGEDFGVWGLMHRGQHSLREWSATAVDGLHISIGPGTHADAHIDRRSPTDRPRAGRTQIDLSTRKALEHGLQELGPEILRIIGRKVSDLPLSVYEWLVDKLAFLGPGERFLRAVRDMPRSLVDAAIRWAVAGTILKPANAVEHPDPTQREKGSRFVAVKEYSFGTGHIAGARTPVQAPAAQRALSEPEAAAVAKAVTAAQPGIVKPPGGRGERGSYPDTTTVGLALAGAMLYQLEGAHLQSVAIDLGPDFHALSASDVAAVKRQLSIIGKAAREALGAALIAARQQDRGEKVLALRALRTPLGGRVEWFALH